MNIHDFYKEELSKKKTISSKKAFLTKSHKAVSEYLKDLNDHKAGGWLLGERVTHIRISRVKTELKVIENLKKALEKTGLKGVRNNAGKTPAEAQKRVALKLELKKIGHQRSETAYLTTKQLEALLNKTKKGLKGVVSKPKSIVESALKTSYNDLEKAYESVNQSLAKYVSSPNGTNTKVRERIINLNSALSILERKIFQDRRKKGLKGLPSGMTKSIAKSIKVTGLRKEDGTLQKGYKYLKGGKIVKTKTKKKDTKTAK